MHDAGAALARVAADVSAGEAELLAQQLHQQGPAFDGRRHRLAVHGKAHRLLHRYLPVSLASAVGVTAEPGRSFMPGPFAVKPLAGDAPAGEEIKYAADDGGEPRYPQC